MYISTFHLMPHRELPDDFEKRFSFFYDYPATTQLVGASLNTAVTWRPPPSCTTTCAPPRRIVPLCAVTTPSIIPARAGRTCATAGAADNRIATRTVIAGRIILRGHLYCNGVLKTIRDDYVTTAQMTTVSRTPVTTSTM